MRTILLAVVLASAAAAGSGCSKDDKAEKAHSDLPTVTIADVDKGIAANELTVVDCNGDKVRKKYGIIPGAVLVEDEEAFTADVLPPDKTRKLVFYCSGPS
jgi:hypothetical protein